jgi:hypothetical protein
MSGGHDGLVAVWDVLHGTLLTEIRLFSDMPAGSRVLDGAFAPSGTQFAVSNFYGELVLFGFGPQPVRALNRYPTEQFLPDESQPLIYDRFGWCVDAQSRVPPHLMPRPPLIDFAGAGHDDAIFNVGAPPPYVATDAHRRLLSDRAASRAAALHRVRLELPLLWSGGRRRLEDATPLPARTAVPGGAAPPAPVVAPRAWQRWRRCSDSARAADRVGPSTCQ